MKRNNETLKTWRAIRSQGRLLKGVIAESGFDPGNRQWRATPYSKKCLAASATMIRHLAAKLNGITLPQVFLNYLEPLVESCGEVLELTGPYHPDMSEEGKDLVRRHN